MKQLKLTETVLRDSHQSLFATRMTTDEMLPILISGGASLPLMLKLLGTKMVIGIAAGYLGL